MPILSCSREALGPSSVLPSLSMHTVSVFFQGSPRPEFCTPIITHTVFVFPGKPSAPALLEVSNVTEDSVTLSWLSPERDGGAKIFRYIVEMRDPARAEGWIRVKEVDSCDILVACVDNLHENRPYMFRVYAENEVGAGLANELREPIVPRSLIGELCHME